MMKFSDGKKWISLFFCAALTVPAFGRPDDTLDSLIIKGKSLLKQGLHRWDEKSLLEARSFFERLLEKDEMKWLSHYYVGYADYRLAIYYQTQNKKEAYVKYLDDGIDNLNASIELNDKSADAFALLSSVLGMKIGADPSLAMKLGMESSAMMSEAESLDPDNPRAVMIKAISTYFTPEQFGGSRTQAIEQMKQAVELFTKEKIDDRRLPHWGHSEALAWLAQFYLDQQSWDEAQAYLKQALRVDPQNGFALKVQRELQKRETRK